MEALIYSARLKTIYIALFRGNDSTAGDAKGNCQEDRRESGQERRLALPKNHGGERGNPIPGGYRVVQSGDRIFGKPERVIITKEDKSGPDFRPGRPTQIQRTISGII
jgi:hypothetical protein